MHSITVDHSATRNRLYKSTKKRLSTQAETRKLLDFLLRFLTPQVTFTRPILHHNPSLDLGNCPFPPTTCDHPAQPRNATSTYETRYITISLLSQSLYIKKYLIHKVSMYKQLSLTISYSARKFHFIRSFSFLLCRINHPKKLIKKRMKKERK